MIVYIRQEGEAHIIVKYNKLLEAPEVPFHVIYIILFALNFRPQMIAIVRSSPGRTNSSYSPAPCETTQAPSSHYQT